MKKFMPWHVYLVKFPYYDKNTAKYTYKARPAIYYKSAGIDITFLPITSNENEDGSKKNEENKFQVAVKFQKHGLVKVNQPMCVSQEAILDRKHFGFQVPMNIRRKIITAWDSLMTWPKTK